MTTVVENKPVMAPSRPKAKANGKAIRKVAIWVFTVGLILAPSLLHSKAGIGFSPILSGSMHPAASTGDLFLTRVVKASTLRVGDIITVNNQVTGTFYAHRIVEIRTTNSVLRILTKGDANPSIDQEPYLISPAGEVSKEFFVLPLIGRPMIYLTSFQGRQAATMLLVASNVLGIFFLLFRKKIKTNLNNERVYKELYSDERPKSGHYRNLIDHLKSIEMENNLAKNER